MINQIDIWMKGVIVLTLLAALLSTSILTKYRFWAFVLFIIADISWIGYGYFVIDDMNIILQYVAFLFVSGVGLRNNRIRNERPS